MNKIFKILLSLLLVISFSVPINADQSTSLFAYTSSTDNFDRYAKEKIDDHLYSYYGYLDASFKLGAGITVYGDVDIPLVVYPVWRDSQIIGTFKVIYFNNEYSGSYSEGNANQLNYAKEISNENNPILLIRSNKQLFYAVGDEIYNASGKDINEIKTVQLDSIDSTNSNIIDAGTCLTSVNPTVARAASSWYLPWNYTEHNELSTAYCHAYSLSAMLTNLGYSGYNFTFVRDSIKQYPSATIGLAYVNFYKVIEFLEEEGFNADDTDNGAGSLTSSQVEDRIYNYRTYILAGLTFINDDSDTVTNHFGVIKGYSNISGAYTYGIYDPQSDGNGTCTMDASTKRFTNSDGSSFVWDAGYVSKVSK